MSPLLAIAVAVALGKSPAAVGAMVGAITFDQWAQVGIGLLKAAPDIVKDLDAMPKPATGAAAVDQIGRALVTGIVRKSVKDWFAANGRAAIRIQTRSIRNQR